MLRCADCPSPLASADAPLPIQVSWSLVFLEDMEGILGSIGGGLSIGHGKGSRLR